MHSLVAVGRRRSAPSPRSIAASREPVPSRPRSRRSALSGHVLGRPRPLVFRHSPLGALAGAPLTCSPQAPLKSTLDGAVLSDVVQGPACSFGITSA